MAWLYQPNDKAKLGDVAKLAVTLRSGAVPQLFLDEGFAEAALGTVGRVLLMAPTELGLPPSERKFALARGTSQLCLAEIVPGEADAAAARAHIDAVERQRARSEGKKVIGWLIAVSLTSEAKATLAEHGALGTSTGVVRDGPDRH